jgi:hypothetical protein
MVSDTMTTIDAGAREALHQVAAHVLARRRFAATGRVGLRPAPGGLATPAFGDGEVVRVSGGVLVVERAGGTRAEPLTTLGRAAELVGVDLAEEFSAGPETPPLPDPGAPLGVDEAVTRSLGAWWGFGADVMDEVVATTRDVSGSSAAQLWPEHFDHACTLVVRGEVQLNVGASPGDGFEPSPYLYVGPWGPDRPGDPAYWNAPFGAVLRRSETDGRAEALAFLRRGIDLVARG